MSLEFFGKENAYYSKNYIDYLLKEIKKKNCLNEKEEKIIRTATRKYYVVKTINLLLIIMFSRLIFINGKVLHLNINANYLSSLAIKSFLFLIPIYYTNVKADKVYYNQLRYLIKKYSYVKEEDYQRTSLNNKIIKLYNRKVNNNL